jgi:predicted CoA-binding protein
MINNNLFDNLENKIQKFFESPAFGVVGASIDRNKYGNKVVRCYLQHNKIVYPINPHESTIEGLTCIKTLDTLPVMVKSISIITNPSITEKVVEQAIMQGIQNIWMQPGSDNITSVLICENNAINVINGGPCILVTLGFKEEY